MKKKPSLLIFAILIHLQVFSQLTVTTNSVATTLAQTITGSGITVTNATITCNKKGAGTFTYSGSNLGETGGVILTTGYASEATYSVSGGVAVVPDEDLNTTTNDPNLTSISVDDDHDVCILQFDFVPICSNISITYVFASAEYPEYVCDVYNDGFGIFLTGTNPSGAAYNGTNIATLPNGNLVAINNVNNGNPGNTDSGDPACAATNLPYFVTNYTYTTTTSFGTTTTDVTTGTNQQIAYSGYTIPITSVKPVSPCSTYHMKIAIADNTDGYLDSGVFIQGNSVSCTNTPTITASATPANCGNTGSATATVTNYTGTTTYQWQPGGATTATISNLAAGTYTCTVGLQLGCSGVTDQTITATVPATGSTFSYTTTPQNPLCNGGTNGSASITISGGVAPYTYTWTTTPPQTTANASNLAAGTYVVNIKDNAGCAGTTSVTITNPPAIVATVTTTPTTCTASIGSTTAIISSGGNAPYTYTWSTTPIQTGQTAGNLAQGTYTVAISDVNGCPASATGIVGTQSFAWSPSASETNPTCAGAANGTATVSITNAGSSTFTYSWSTTPAQTNTIATNLLAGNYTVYVTDNNGCISTASVLISNPPAIPATINTSPTICTGSVGSATAAVTSGGTAPYTYTWSPSGGNAATVVNLAQGSYSVSITDANGCLASATGSVSSTGFTWSPSVSGTNPICIGKTDGTATVSINNPGNSTFTYSWIPTAQTNSVTTGLSAGGYTVSVTDNNGCLSTATGTLTNPPPITATVNTSPTICTGSVGSATATVISGGTAPYTYTWTTNPVQAGQSIANLPSGAYSVFITDANGCQSLALFTGTVSSTPATWTAIASQTPATCYGKADGTATVSIANPGANTFTYSWMPTSQTTAIATGLSAVTIYTATVIDENGCIGKASVTVTQPNPIVLSTTTSPAICTTNNGTAIVTASGGTSPYTYLWNTVPIETSSTATNLAQGPYAVIVYDVNTCTATITATVKDTADLTVTASSSPDLCSKGVGKATANPKGETPYQYTWTTNPVQITQVADSLKVGSYSVTVVDAFGCISGASTTVVNHNDILSTDFNTAPAGPIYAENATTIILTTNSGWTVDTGTAYLSNGIPITGNPFNYTFLQYGDYTATYYFTSIHGCKDTITYPIVVTDYMTLYIPNAFTPNGDGKNDVFAAEGTFIDSFEMYIYDRWGVLVTKLDNINKVWDGTKNGGGVSEDTYVYKGDAFDIFGKHVSFQGQVNLIR